MINYLWPLILLLASSSLMAETIQGILGDFYFNGDTITVDGQTFQCNMEATRVVYGGQLLAEEDLSEGDEVQLIFRDETSPGELKKLEVIILLKGHKKGLDS